MNRTQQIEYQFTRQELAEYLLCPNNRLGGWGLGVAAFIAGLKRKGLFVYPHQEDTIRYCGQEPNPEDIFTVKVLAKAFEDSVFEEFYNFSSYPVNHKDCPCCEQ